MSRVERLPGWRVLRAHASGLAVSGVAGAAGVAGSYATAGFTPSFVAGPIAGQLARRMPAAAIRFAIVVLGDLGKKLNLLTAIMIAVGLFALVAFVGRLLAGRLERRGVDVAVGGVGAAGISLAVTGSVAASAGAGVAVGGVVLLAAVGSATGTGGVGARRELLGGLAASLAVVAGGVRLGNSGGLTTETTSSTSLDVSVESLVSEAEEKSLDVDGLEPLLSETFYTVDINATDPVIDPDEWTLSVTGAVGQELEYTLDDIREMDAESRVVSLRCVGERLNGQKLDNAVWTGVPISKLIEPAIVPDECCVMLRAEDDFFEEFPLDALEDSMLAYGMNGEKLPRKHGAPARALVPGRWGEVNVKWLSEIEILTQPEDGYWENRGWQGTGPVNTVAKLRTQNTLDDGRIEVAGRAYAGTRGIRQVEVSTDGGTTWNEATLSEELPSDDALRQWVYRYDPPAEAHEVVVRATDKTGTLQPREQSKPFPSGPTGWVSVTVDPDTG